MDMIAILIIAILAVLIALSAYFSASETAFTSVNKIRLKNLVKEGNKRAEKTLGIAENFDKMLTTILVGNNVVNIFASSLCTILFGYLLVTSNEFVISIVSTLVMTLLLLIFGEITPKSIAKENAESVAMFVTPTLSAVIWVFTPVSICFMKLKNVMTKRFRKGDSPTMTEEELIVMIEEIEEEGTLEKHESELIRSAIEFDDITADEILTPRVDIKGIDVRSDKYEIKYAFTSTGYSRLPVYDDTVDRIIGVIYVKDFYNMYLDSETAKLEDILRPVKFIPETTKISGLLNDLQRSKTHMAVILDSYGGTVGILTLEDILEELVGEIWDEHDEVEYSVVKENDGSYSVLGGANIYDVMDEIGIRFDPEDFEDHTIAGYIQYKLDRIPAKGDSVTVDNAVITVKSTKNRRIRDVSIKVSERPEE